MWRLTCRWMRNIERSPSSCDSRQLGTQRATESPSRVTICLTGETCQRCVNFLLESRLLFSSVSFSHVFARCLEQTGKHDVAECDFWVWIVAALTVWNALKGEFVSRSWKWNERSSLCDHAASPHSAFSQDSAIFHRMQEWLLVPS